MKCEKKYFQRGDIKYMYNKNSNKASNNNTENKQAVPNRAHTEMKKGQNKANNCACDPSDKCRSKADNKNGSNKAE